MKGFVVDDVEEEEGDEEKSEKSNGMLKSLKLFIKWCFRSRVIDKTVFTGFLVFFSVPGFKLSV